MCFHSIKSVGSVNDCGQKDSSFICSKDSCVFPTVGFNQEMIHSLFGGDSCSLKGLPVESLLVSISLFHLFTFQTDRTELWEDFLWDDVQTGSTKSKSSVNKTKILLRWKSKCPRADECNCSRRWWLHAAEGFQLNESSWISSLILFVLVFLVWFVVFKVFLHAGTVPGQV